MNKKKKGPIMKRSFEPNRLAEDYLMDAYECLMPRIKANTTLAEKEVELALTFKRTTEEIKS